MSTAFSIALHKLTLFCLNSAQWGVEMYSQIKNCKPMYSLSIYHKFCCNTVEYMYIYAFLIRDKRILKQTKKSAFSRKYYATILQRRLNFSQYSFLIHKKQVVRLNFLFQPVTCKRAEVKRADSREPTFYLNYKLIIYGKFCDKLIWLLN